MTQQKNMVVSVKDKLLNISKSEKRSFDSVLLLYMQERLLYRISISKYSEKFILKGGLFLFSINELKSRPTKDIDFLAYQMASDVEQVKKVFFDICNIETNDGLLFDVNSIQIERIKEDANYEGVRTKINVYLGKAKKVLQMDVGFGDIVIPKPIYIDYPTLLDMQVPNIKVYSAESVIAEKFEAMVTFSVLNSRMKDFYDVYILLCDKQFDGRVLQEAIYETFQRRRTKFEKDIIIFENEFSEDESRHVQWKSFLNRIGEEQFVDFKEIMKYIKIFLQPVYKAIINEDEFFRQWDNKQKKWVKY